MSALVIQFVVDGFFFSSLSSTKNYNVVFLLLIFQLQSFFFLFLIFFFAPFVEVLFVFNFILQS